MAILMSVVATPAPSTSSRGRPNSPWISAQASTKFEGTAARVIHSAGSGRLTAPMNPRMAMNTHAGIRLQPRPAR